MSLLNIETADYAAQSPLPRFRIDPGPTPGLKRDLEVLKWVPRPGHQPTFYRSGETLVEEPHHRPLRIAIVTDAWEPQMNGVVRTLKNLRFQLEAKGHSVLMVTPDDFTTLPLPSYPEIRMAISPRRKISEMLKSWGPDAIHISTEGPLGLAARQFCLASSFPFTTAFHSRLPEYIYARTHFPVTWGYELEKRFHRPATVVMVPTQTIQKEMIERGFENTRLWSRGVDLKNFEICPTTNLDVFPRPFWLYVGRVAVEKNISAFLDLDLPGTKFVVGDGPQLPDLRDRYRDVQFVGRKEGRELAQFYTDADVFVFPSKTDTFGLVNVEALACGTPVAAFPVAGPQDILRDYPVGAVDTDLRHACFKALGIASSEACRRVAAGFSWEACATQFLANLAIPLDSVAKGSPACHPE